MKKQTAGFTAPEVLTVVAIIGILGSLAVSSFAQATRDANVRDRVLELTKNLDRSRRAVRTGVKNMAQLNGRVVSAGLQFRSTGYDVFVDADEEAGGEVFIRTVNVDASRLVITQAPSEVRFVSDGTIGGNQDVEIRIYDSERKRTHGVTVTYGGRASLADTDFTK